MIYRLLIENRNNGKEFSINEVPDLITSNNYCGWFLKWFYHINIRDSQDRNDFKNALKSIYPIDNSNEKTIDESKALFHKAETYCAASRRRWCNFFMCFWNHIEIQQLLDKNDPHATLIENERCGFGFITQTFAKCFNNKVFYGQDLIPSVIIVNEKKNSNLEINLRLFNVQGR